MEDSFLELERELARVREQLEATRREVASLKTSPAHRRTTGLFHRPRIRLALLATLGVASMVIAQTQTGKTTKFQAPFEVVDEDGKTILRVVKDGKFRGFQAMGLDGKPICLLGTAGESKSGSIAVIGEGGQGFAELAIADDTGMVAVGSSAGMPLGYLGPASAVNKLSGGIAKETVGNREGIALRLQEEDGTAVAELSNNTDESGTSLKIRSKKGAVVAGLGANPGGDGSAALKISNAKGEILASMEILDNTGHVNVFAPSGSALANMGAESNGKGFVRVGAVENREAVSLTVGSGGGGVVQTKDTGGMGVIIGTREGKGDLCANGKKGLMCFSALCAKNIMPYW